MGIWARSGRVYSDLKSQGLDMPSVSTLRRRKNTIKQGPGINRDMLQLMHQEAEKLGLDESSRSGGLMWDEMSLQVRDI